MRKFRVGRANAAVLATLVAVAVASCSSGAAGGGSGENAMVGGLAGRSAGVIGEEATGTPVQGGTLTFAVYSEVGQLDPAASPGSGPSGGSEMAAVFDVLMRVDGETDQLQPQLAQSLEPSVDSQTWTLRLRDGVAFTDGAPMTAESVKGSIERYMRLNGGNAKMWQQSVAEIQTPDDKTVVFTLKEPWAGFGFLLAGTGGMIVAPGSGDGAAFKPVGTGPFALTSYAPSESMILTANPNYWGGAPYLDAVRIVYLSNPETIVDSLSGGSIDVGFLRDQVAVDDALNRGFGGVLRAANLGNIALVNAAAGHPGSDDRVRQAMFLAIDPVTVVDRTTRGSGVASNAVFSELSKWGASAEPDAYDPDAARALLDAAKADGYSGTVNYLFEQSPNEQAKAVAVKSMLDAVGFNVQLEPVGTVADKISRVLAHQNYDIVTWGLSLFDDNPYDRLSSYLHSALDAVQNSWGETVPALVFGPVFEFVAQTDKVQGVVGTTNTVVLLDKAWLSPGG